MSEMFNYKTGEHVVQNLKSELKVEALRQAKDFHCGHEVTNDDVVKTAEKFLKFLEEEN